MKRIVCVMIMIVSTLYVQGQDTIVLTTGEKNAVQILKETTQEVYYKPFSNLLGPTRIKQRSGIDEIKRGPRIPALPGQTIDFSIRGRNGISSECRTGEEVVLQIDSIYRSGKFLDDIEKQEQEYLALLQPCVKMKSVQEYYLNRFDSSAVNGIDDYILQDGEIYLLIGGEDKFLDVLEVVVKMYASAANNSNVEWWMEFFDAYSQEIDDIFAEDVMRLRSEVNGILHQNVWEKGIRGTWVLLNNVSNKGFMPQEYSCPLILEVEDVGKPQGGAHLVQPSIKFRLHGRHTKSLKDLYEDEINDSQNIYFENELSQYAIFQFSTETIKDRRWASDLANQAIDVNRDVSVRMNAENWVSESSTGQKAVNDLAISVTSGVINVLFTELSSSSEKKEVYNIITFPNKPDVMNALVSSVSVQINSSSDDNNVTYEDSVNNKKSYLVRWVEEDSVIFVSKNKRPITLSSINKKDPILDEYWNIRDKHSLGNPAYLIPFVVGNLTGVYLFTKVSGNRHNLSRAFAYGFGGLGVCLFTNVCTFVLMKENGSKEFDEFNRRNLAKLRKKASASLSLSPTYSPGNNALGAAVNLSF